MRGLVTPAVPIQVHLPSTCFAYYAEGGATEAYCSRAVCHYAEGGATEAYCSRVVCHSVRHAYLVTR